MKVLLVDDHPLVRQGLRTILDNTSDVVVVGEASSGHEAIAQTRALDPDVVVMDINMPGMDGIEATAAIKTDHPGVSIIMLTVNDDELLLAEAVRAGAAAYVLKDASAELLLQSLRAVSQGGTVISTRLLQKALHGIKRQKPAVSYGLSPRETEVLGHLAQGMSNHEIAEALHLAHVTVKKHIQGILAKLEVSDRTQAAIKALRSGLVD